MVFFMEAAEAMVIARNARCILLFLTWCPKQVQFLSSRHTIFDGLMTNSWTLLTVQSTDGQHDWKL